MENRLSYILVGLFLLILFLATALSIVWLGNYSNQGLFKFYNVVINESVSGLNEKAPVKLNGVPIGEVRAIKINPQNAEEVLVTIRVEESAPIKENTYALIQAQGITGLSFIQLQGGTHTAAALKTGTKPEEYAHIHSHPSAIARLDKTLSSLSQKAETIFSQAEAVLNERNIAHLETILHNTAIITAATARTLQKHEHDIAAIMQQTLLLEKSLQETAQSVERMAETLQTTLAQEGVTMMQSITATSTSLKDISETLHTKLTQGAFDVHRIAKEQFLPLHDTLQELNVLTHETKSLIEHLNSSPSDLFFQAQTFPPAPNEP